MFLGWTPVDWLVFLVGLPLAFWFIGVRGGLRVMHQSFKPPRPIPWVLSQDSHIGRSLDKGGGRWKLWNGLY